MPARGVTLRRLPAMAWLGPAVLGLSAALALVAVWTDVKRREVPHWIVIGLALLWGVAAVWAPAALGAAPTAGLLCGAAALLFGFILHALGWLGGGDGKLLAVLAMWLGPADIGLALLATGALGLLLALPAMLRGDGEYRRRGLPLAAAIAPPAATLLAARALG